MTRIERPNVNASGQDSSGFTLLEVIVALAITGFVLGGLFTLVAGSKQLTWRSEDSLLRATKLRAAANFALLQNEYQEVEFILEQEDFFVQPLDLLEDPIRKTEPTVNALQAFEIEHEEREEVFIGYRWVQLELPQ